MAAVVSIFGMTPRSKLRGNNTHQFVLADRLMGVEIEVEQISDSILPSQSQLLRWQNKSDGSLRSGREYVLREPMAGSNLSAAVDEIFALGRFYPAATSSTHIHLDVREENVSPEVLQTLTALVYMLEPVLFGIGDTSRKWCGYTHPIKDLPAPLLSAIFRTNGGFDPTDFARNIQRGSRYYGYNMNAIAKYGSIEFRYFPTATSASQLTSWINLVQSFANAAEEIGSIPALNARLSVRNGYSDLLTQFFAPYVTIINEFVTEKEALLSFKEVINVSQGEDADSDFSLSTGSEDTVKEQVLNAHPYLRKLVKKKARAATVPAADPDLAERQRQMYRDFVNSRAAAERAAMEVLNGRTTTARASTPSF